MAEYVDDLTRDNVQLLINELFKIPTEVKEDTVVFKLPKPVTRLPREKPVSSTFPAKLERSLLWRSMLISRLARDLCRDFG